MEIERTSSIEREQERKTSLKTPNNVNNVHEERATRRLKKKRNSFDGVDSEMYKKALKVQILNEVAA